MSEGTLTVLFGAEFVAADTSAMSRNGFFDILDCVAWSMLAAEAIAGLNCDGLAARLRNGLLELRLSVRPLAAFVLSLLLTAAGVSTSDAAKGLMSVNL